MNIVIIGAGVVGVTQAYVLASRGHSVTVVDRQMHVAAETSFANGAQLSYAYHEPIASPHNLRHVLSWLMDPDGPLVLKDAPRTLNFLHWSWQYLRACRAAASEAAGLSLLQLGLYSRQKMEALRHEILARFDFHESGILHIFTDSKQWAREAAAIEGMVQHGLVQKPLDKAACEQIEPALQNARKKIVGGIFSPQDASGDPHRFCEILAEIATQKYGVHFMFGSAVKSLISTARQQITGVLLANGETITADAVILAAGSFSGALVQSLNISIPLQAMKGYSLTFEADDTSPSVSITDVDKRLVHTRLGDRMRVAGFAEFAGWNDAVTPARMAQLKQAMCGLFDYKTHADAQPWACLRAATPDGLPVLGATPTKGLFLNTGHGMLGWTQAAGCAHLVADVIEEKHTDIPLHAFDHSRFR